MPGVSRPPVPGGVGAVSAHLVRNGYLAEVFQYNGHQPVAVGGPSANPRRDTPQLRLDVLWPGLERGVRRTLITLAEAPVLSLPHSESQPFHPLLYPSAWAYEAPRLRVPNLFRPAHGAG